MQATGNSLTRGVMHEFHRSGKEVRQQQWSLAKERLNVLYAHIPTDMGGDAGMNAKRLVILVALLAGWCLIVGLGPVSAQQAPPTEHKGVKAEVLTTIDLGPRFWGCKVAKLRLRRVTVEPGGAFAVHSHKESSCCRGRMSSRGHSPNTAREVVGRSIKRERVGLRGSRQRTGSEQRDEAARGHRRGYIQAVVAKTGGPDCMTN